MLLQTGIAAPIVATIAIFLAVSVFYALTLHLAATFFLGDVPSQKAATVGPVPAIVSILLGRWGIESVAFISAELGVLVVVSATLLADGLAIARTYRLDRWATVALTLLHFAFATALGISLANLLGFV
ncbi:hypothetical protein Hrd1104_09790 [Halorhabdus sp. CBA1104]|uniref:DUF7473 family protein n=1 Tax=unclassified Halorhabdus TaxID=2621901 RepID=UPI0012B2E52A|nr:MULTISPECIES: hypothetical protein [unclassified Halorhabdus]QGN07568.1 hypothetical protein Hrd1104_09790 [Halorhabdus sp. CBA1104]